MPPKGTCSIEGCEKPRHGRGWCAMHYMRWKAHGTTTLPERGPIPTTCAIDECGRPRVTKDGLCTSHRWRLQKYGTTDPPPPKPTECSVDDCHRPRLARGWCGSHWARWRRTGQVGDAQLRPIGRRRGSPCTTDGCRRCAADPSVDKCRLCLEGVTCSAEDCEKPPYSQNLCTAHALRLTRRDTLELIYPERREPGYTLTYSGVHQRLYRIKGAASNSLCVNCGQQADEWSYVHGAADRELIDEKTGFPYSADPDHYVPRCRPCHRHYDNQKE